MPITLPNLDDRRWTDLVDEGLALIPFYAPKLTDHNVSDPFRTLVELLAWVAEMDAYMLNRIPESHVRKFLALLGIEPAGPQPAQALLQLACTVSGSPLQLPAGLVFSGIDTNGQATRFSTRTSLTIIDSKLASVFWQDESGVHDMTTSWQRGEIVSLFGQNPAPPAAVYLGFEKPVPVNRPATLYFAQPDTGAAMNERERLYQLLVSERKACRPATPVEMCGRAPGGEISAEPKLLAHHSVRTVWEFYTADGRWRRLDSASGEVIDETRAFTLDGRVVLQLPAEMGAKRMRQNAPELFFVRCRMQSGFYEAPPRVRTIALNGVAAEQAVECGAFSWILAPGATIDVPHCEETGPPATDGIACRVGQKLQLQLRHNARGEIEHVALAENADTPALRILAYQPPTASVPGRLTVEAEYLGTGSGEPQQTLELSQKPAVKQSLALYALQGDRWRRWQPQPDFLASTATDAHFILQPTRGIVTAGDGNRGMVFEPGAKIFALYRSTRAEAGNLEKDRVDTLVDSQHNRALLFAQNDRDSFDETEQLVETSHALPLTDGKAAESTNAAAGQAILRHQKSQMAVTLADYQTLAMETPGTRLARAQAFANLHPHFLCLHAPGVITVMVLPYLPQDRPQPSAGLCRMVKAYLMQRRVVGTRVEVLGPKYLEITVRAKVAVCAGVHPAQARQRIIENLHRFFHPLHGGPDDSGWPFGRDVYRSEVLQVIDETPGVDYVVALELLPDAGEPQCGNVCIGAFGLVASGEHVIEIPEAGVCPRVDAHSNRPE